MSYTLKLTNGKLLLTLPDQQSDRVSTSLTLIGKNVNAYGTDINQNYIHILENFANATAPRSPLLGQLWYDTNAQTLKVYTKNNSFKSVGAPIISSIEPITLGVGEFWYDTASEQMKFKVDSSNIITVGPETNAVVGKSGWVNETVFNTSDNSQTVVSLYSNNVLMGVLSNYESIFNVRSDYIESLSGLTELKFGFNPINNLSRETVWWGTADNADKFGGLTPQQFIRDEPGSPLIISSASSMVIRPSLTIGANNDFIFTPADSANIASLMLGGRNQNVKLIANSSNDSKGPALFIDGANNRVGFFTETPLYDVDVSGDMRVSGNLTVSGTATYITSEDLLVLDRVIVLGETPPVNDFTKPYDGAVVVRNDVRDKEIRWITNGADYSGIIGNAIDNSWSITDNINLRFIDSGYYIFGDKVIDRTSLGPQVISAPGLTEIGALSSLEVGSLLISTSATNTTTTIANKPGYSNYKLSIGNGDTPEVSFKNAGKVTAPYPGANTSQVETTQELGDHVATVKYVNDQISRVGNPTLALSIDVTNHADSLADEEMDRFVIEMLTFLWDPNDPDPNYRTPPYTRARVLCVKTQSIQIDNQPSDWMKPGVRTEVDKDGIQSSVAVMPWSRFYRVTTTIPAKELTVQRVVKEYTVDPINGAGAWIAKGGRGLDNIVSSTGVVNSGTNSSSFYWNYPKGENE